MRSDTAMMLAYPDFNKPVDPFQGREVEPITDLHSEWLSRLSDDRLERHTIVLRLAGFGATETASEYSDELSRREGR